MLKGLLFCFQVLSVVTDELLQHIDNKTSTTDRVLKPNNLLLIVAELIRSYPQSANMILNLRHNEHLFLQLLLENIILDGKQTAEMSVSANSVFYSVMNANNTTECNETMVQIVRASLKSVLQSIASKETELSKEDGKEYCQKLTTLTKFVGLLKDCNTPVSSINVVMLFKFYIFRLPTRKTTQNVRLFTLCMTRVCCLSLSKLFDSSH